MENGTYAEAFEAGFTEDQAAMLARLSIGIKNEMRQTLLQGAEPANKQKTLSLKSSVRIAFLFGGALGSALTLVAQALLGV